MDSKASPDAKKRPNQHIFWLGVIILIGFLLPVVSFWNGEITWPIFAELTNSDISKVVSIFLIYPVIAGLGAIILSLFCRGVSRSIAIVVIGVLFIVVWQNIRPFDNSLFNIRSIPTTVWFGPIDGFLIMKFTSIVFLVGGVWALCRVPKNFAASMIAAIGGVGCIIFFICELFIENEVLTTWTNIIPMMGSIGSLDFFGGDFLTFSIPGITGWVLSAFTLISSSLLAVALFGSWLFVRVNIDSFCKTFSPAVGNFIQKHIRKFILWAVLVTVLLTVILLTLDAVAPWPHPHSSRGHEDNNPAYHGHSPIPPNLRDYSIPSKYHMHSIRGDIYSGTVLTMMLVCLIIVRFTNMDKLIRWLTSKCNNIQSNTAKYSRQAAFLLLANILLMIIAYFVLSIRAYPEKTLYFLLTDTKSFCWVGGLFLLIPAGLADLITNLSKDSKLEAARTL